CDPQPTPSPPSGLVPRPRLAPPACRSSRSRQSSVPDENEPRRQIPRPRRSREPYSGDGESNPSRGSLRKPEDFSDGFSQLLPLLFLLRKSLVTGTGEPVQPRAPIRRPDLT